MFNLVFCKESGECCDVERWEVSRSVALVLPIYLSKTNKQNTGLNDHHRNRRWIRDRDEAGCVQTGQVCFFFFPSNTEFRISLRVVTEEGRGAATKYKWAVTGAGWLMASRMDLPSCGKGRAAPKRTRGPPNRALLFRLHQTAAFRLKMNEY